jgi:hypothetical protein
LRGPAKEGLFKSPNGFYIPGEDGCYIPLLAVLFIDNPPPDIKENPILQWHSQR